MKVDSDEKENHNQLSDDSHRFHDGVYSSHTGTIHGERLFVYFYSIFCLVRWLPNEAMILVSKFGFIKFGFIFTENKKLHANEKNIR